MPSQIPNQNVNRKSYLDLLRIIAIICVIYNHTSTDGFAFFTLSHTRLYPVYMAVSVFIRINNPLFFMISGALLIPKEEPISTVFRKRVARYVVVLVVASAFIYLHRIGWDFTEASLSTFFTTLYSDRWVTWFLYSYLAYLITLPILRKVAVSLSDKDYFYLIILYLFVQCITIFDWLLFKGSAFHNKYFILFITTENMFFPLLGYFLDSRFPKYMNKSTILYIFAAALAGIAVTCLLTQARCNYIGKWDEDEIYWFIDIFRLIPASGVFLGVKSLFNRKTLKPEWYNILRKVGSCSFVIILTEGLARDLTKPVYLELAQHMPVFLASWIWVLIVYCICLAFAYIVKLIPGINRFV